MFKKNARHLQPALISAASELPEKQRQRLEQSWAGTFYREFFSRLDEDAFAVLYSDRPSRPNVPVNVLVGLEALKAGHGWSDAELYENFCFNLQVRYALGYDRLGDGDFEIRTLYYFRERLSHYHLARGVNLLEKAFAHITEAQLIDLKVRSGMQRMDSTQIASNIVAASRLRLLVTGLQRAERMLNAADRTRLAETFAPYIEDSAGHYTYRVKGQAAVTEHLQKIGATLHALLMELKPAYADHSDYQVLERLFADHFQLLDSGPRAKTNKELTSHCLQSVDDPEASYCTKGTGHYRGYVANLTETCDPDNELQLITQVQVAPNNVGDSQLLAEALPNLTARTDLETLITDGGFGGPASDSALQAHGVTLIQTALRGIPPDPSKFGLADFQFQLDDHSQPTFLTCPQGQTVAVTPACSTGWQAHFDPAICSTCPFQLAARCRATPHKRDPRYRIEFTTPDLQVAKRRQAHRAHQTDGHNLRAAIEATVRSVKCRFPAGKLPVRGRFRVTCLMIAAAATANVRRIQRYRVAKSKADAAAKNGPGQPNRPAATALATFLASLRAFQAHCRSPWLALWPNSGC